MAMLNNIRWWFPIRIVRLTPGLQKITIEIRSEIGEKSPSKLVTLIGVLKNTLLISRMARWCYHQTFQVSKFSIYDWELLSIPLARFAGLDRPSLSASSTPNPLGAMVVWDESGCCHRHGNPSTMATLWYSNAALEHTGVQQCPFGKNSGAGLVYHLSSFTCC